MSTYHAGWSPESGLPGKQVVSIDIVVHVEVAVQEFQTPSWNSGLSSLADKNVSPLDRIQDRGKDANEHLLLPTRIKL